MIDRYEIKNENNEQVLYLYLDFGYEFANFNFNEQKEKFEKIVKKFINDRKIAFIGTTVAIIVGGMLIGHVHLNQDKVNINLNENNVINEVIPNTEKSNSIDLEQVNNIQKNEEVIDNKDETNNQTDSVEVDNVKKEDQYIKADDKIQNQFIQEENNLKQKQEENNLKQKQEENVEDNQIIEPTSQIEESIQDTKTYVNVKRSTGVINIELEEYVIGVVGAEMPASFDIEALKAQAIIARTYALKLNSRGQILTDTNSTQNYKSNEELMNMWGNSYNTYYNKIVSAVNNTEGLYLSYNNNYIEAVYHSTSNGVTESSANVWGNYFPYLISVDSQYDSINPSFEVSKIISYEELTNKLGSDINIDTNFNILSKTQGDRVETIEINGTIYSGVNIRNILGLRSADFDITKTEEGIIFKTRGYGHGVGMSQYGANGMAKNGYSYRQILEHYYPGTRIDHN